MKTHTLVENWMPFLCQSNRCLIALRRADFDSARECLSCQRFQAPGVRANVSIIVVLIERQRNNQGRSTDS